MRVTAALTFDGYASGKTDFPDDVGPGVPIETFTTLVAAIDTMASLVANPEDGRHVSIVIIGHSDLNDTSGLTVAQRRASEQEAATDRAVSMWEAIKQQVADKVTAMGAEPGDWWESSGNITWALVYAGIGQPKFRSPSNESQRAANRRVTVLISEFPRPAQQ
jgi:flagellar motor protein MotB